MPLIRLDDDIFEYMKIHGKFGERPSDVLRRRLIDFGPIEAKPKKQRYNIFGHPVSRILGWMGQQGWKVEDARAVVNCFPRGEEVSNETIRVKVKYWKGGQIAELTKGQKEELNKLKGKSI